MIKRSLGRGLEDISEVFLSKTDEDDLEENFRDLSSRKIREEDCSSCNEMAIITPEIIQAGEKELFSYMLSSFDEFQVEKLFQDLYGLLLKEKMQFKEGKTIVYNNQIAYKLDYKSVAAFVVLLDEMGKFSGFTEPNNLHFSSAKKTESYDKIIDSEIIKIRKAEFLDSLSVSIDNGMITELFRKRYEMETVGKMIYVQGEIIVFNDHITYQFLYEVDVNFSILIDRKGNYINTSNKNNGLSLETAKYPEETRSQLNSELKISSI
jgi:hypothetical protein